MQDLKQTLGPVTATWDGTLLTVANGSFKRQWQLTEYGLATVNLEFAEHNFVDGMAENRDCDWNLFQLITPDVGAELTDVTLTTVEAPPLTSSHVLATAEFVYPDKEMGVRYTIQAYETAPGVRTQLHVRALRPFSTEDIPSFLLESYAESLPIQTPEYSRHAVGYYNDLQHRNHDDTPIMRTENRQGELVNGGRREVYDWANLLCLEHDNTGLVLVKESHKCVNQQGIDTGAFVLHPHDIRVTGLGLKANNYAPTEIWLPHDRYRWAWANWCIPYTGNEAEKQLALKRFDRARFQPHPEKDVHSRSNTWGTRKPGDEARAAATQENVLKEIASCADLGIDTLAIDDGWQVPAAGNDRMQHDWRPHPERFPNGWLKIRKEAEKAGVKLNLWLPGASATLEQMIRNVEQGHFTGFKIDFLNFPTCDHLEAVLHKVERVVEHTGYQLSISWDVTEEAPRLGYYFAREFGSLHSANRKGTFDTNRVHHIAYTPRLVLRDAWHLSHYMNLNQIEIPIQDVDTVDPRIGNASEYSHDYCTAMSVVGLPLFFQETHFLKGKARDDTRNVMHTWRKHREAMAKSYVFPIGDEPCDAAWTGFQCHNPGNSTGYVLIFRELNAQDESREINLHFLDHQALLWHDVLTGDTWESTTSHKRALSCNIKHSPGFRWLRYQQSNKGLDK